MVTSDWAALIAAVENLTIRVAALESLLEGRSQYLRSAFFQKYFGVDLLPSFRLIHSLIAVACAKLGKAVMCHRRKQEVCLLHSCMLCAIGSSYIQCPVQWESIRQPQRAAGVLLIVRSSLAWVHYTPQHCALPKLIAW